MIRAWLMVALPLMAQESDVNFDKILTEINRGRFDKALTQLFPVQSMIRENLNGKQPKMHAGLVARMMDVGRTSAVLSTIALVRSQVLSENFEEASVHAMLIGMGLSGLWTRVPAYQKLNFAKQDVEEAKGPMKDPELRKLGYAAAEASEWDTARKAAAELMGSTEKKDFMDLDPGTLRHSALAIRGLCELGQGDILAAEKTMIDSMKVRGENSMRMMGPSFRLANALLANGRKQSVSMFLQLVAESNWRDSGKAEQWEKDLAACKEPELPRFSAN